MALYSVVYSVDGGEKCTKYVKANTDKDAADKVEEILKRDGCDISKFEVLDVADCSTVPPDEFARLFDEFMPSEKEIAKRKKNAALAMAAGCSFACGVLVYVIIGMPLGKTLLPFITFGLAGVGAFMLVGILSKDKDKDKDKEDS